MSAAPGTVDLELTGMTCASCAARIEKKLNKIDGVHARVNYATEKATVVLDRPVPVADLIATVEATGYGASVSDEDANDDVDPDPTRPLRVRLLVSAALAVPVVTMSMVPAFQMTGWQWLCLALSTPVVFWGGAQFHRAALTNLRHGATTMDTLISVGTLAAYLWSLWALIVGHAGRLGMKHEMAWRLERHASAGAVYFEAAVGIICFLLLGRYLESRAKRSAGAAVRALVHAGAKEATVLRPETDGTVTEVRRRVAALAVGDRILVRPGEKIATDGVVEEGSAAVDNALITGESVPVQVGVGDEVTGGAINTDGRLVVRATRVGRDTELARIAAMVERAQTGKARAQRLADRVSGVFVPVVIGIALVTVAVWLLLGAAPATAIAAAVAVLIIACPCALGLATPTALLVGTGRGAELGIIIKGPEALERSGRIDVVALDKTGTVTTGRMVVQDAHAYGVPAPVVWAAAAAVEASSEHPVARAVVAYATTGRGAVRLPAAADFASIAGSGVTATVDGRTITVGSPAFVTGQTIGVPPGFPHHLDTIIDAGLTPVVVGWDHQVRGLLGVGDTVKESSAIAITRLKELGVRTVLLTGDHEEPARRIAAEVGIDDARSGVRPDGKAAAVADLQASGARVAMVGDGVNDAAALATADLGIAMGAGTDAAIEAADLTLVRSDLADAPTAIRLARATLRTIHGNLFWAFAYNVVAIPLAALGFLTPLVAGAAMACSSLFVVLNSLRLRRFVA